MDDLTDIPGPILHVTATEGSDASTWTVRCRCGWKGESHTTQQQAWTEGDAHLMEANAVKEST